MVDAITAAMEGGIVVLGLVIVLAIVAIVFKDRRK